LLSLPPELLTAVAAHLWTGGHGSAWSALARTCTTAHGACVDAVRCVTLPPVPPATIGAGMQPLTPAWRRVLDSGGASRTLLVSHRPPSEPVEALAPLRRWLAPTHLPRRVEYRPPAAETARRAATKSDPAAADAVVAAATAALTHPRGGGGGGCGDRRCRLRAVRLGRVHYSMDSHEELLYYTPANADVLERLLPALAAAAPDTFLADGWVIRVLGRGGQRLSAGRLRTLRLRRAIVEDRPSHWALASVLRLHGSELEAVTLGLPIEPYALLPAALGDHGYCQEHWPTGYLAFWLGAEGDGGASPPPPPPPPWAPPTLGAPSPVALPALRAFSFLGSVSAADAAALATAAPALTDVRLIGAVGTGALAALALPALPCLDALEFFTVHRPVVLREELPLALARRPRLSLLRLPVGPDCLSASLAAGMVGAQWGGAAPGEAAAWATELVTATRVGTWTAHDADVDRLVGGPAASARGRARPCAALGGAAPAVAPDASAGLRVLSIFLGADATDGAVAALATLPGLATLRLRLDGARRVRLAGGWPPFPALTALALTLAAHPTRGGPGAAAALAALSAPRSYAPARLVHLHVRVAALSREGPLALPEPPLQPADEVGGWATPPPDVAGLADWTALRTLVWDSRACEVHAAAVGGGRDAAEAALAEAVAAVEAAVKAKAATARRVAATLPRVATCVRPVHSPDPWAPQRPHDVEPWHLYPDGGEPPGGEAAYLDA